MNQPPTTTGSVRGVGTRKTLTGLSLSKALFFGAAGIAYVLSIWLWFSGDRERGLYVGLWVPSILAAGALLLTGNRND